MYRVDSDTDSNTQEEQNRIGMRSQMKTLDEVKKIKKRASSN